MTLSGIVSFGGEFCAEAGCPGAYTRVTAFLDWIKENRKYRCSGNQCGNTVDTEIKVTTQAHGPARDSGHVLTIFSLLNVIFMLTTSIFVQA